MVLDKVEDNDSLGSGGVKSGSDKSKNINSGLLPQGARKEVLVF
jgi:hypothetical protein